MRRLRALFGGLLPEVLKELQPFILELLRLYLVNLLSGTVQSVSRTPKAEDGFGGYQPSITVAMTEEDHQLQELFLEFIKKEIGHQDLVKLAQMRIAAANNSFDLQNSSPGGSVPPAPPSAGPQGS